MAESDVEQRITPIYTRYSDVQTTILAAPGEIQIHLRTWSQDAAPPSACSTKWSSASRMALGESVFTVDGQPLEEIVASELTRNHATIATAESCTGGLLAERLTRIPGSSAYFLGGVVCYSNELKTAWADVPAALIEAKGAVSPEVAQALADGIRRRTGATSASASPASPGRAAARRKNPSAWCTSRWPTPQAFRNAASISPATANASAGTPRRPRWTWFAATFSIRRSDHAQRASRPGSAQG